MQDRSKRLPVPKDQLPGFAPVPRKPRHDGWTPERQRAFVGALADTGCVAIAARMVNMTSESAYQLRRAPGAESFRKAWEAAQGLGLQVVKDEAFHRALHGQLVPVFVAGKLMGFRRKKNDRLLMFILRQYGFAQGGGRTTVNYVSTKAVAGAVHERPSPLAGEGDSRSERGEGAGGAAAGLAAAATTTVRTIVTGSPRAPAAPSDDEAARLLENFAGVALDAQAKADIYRALEAAAERRRALDADPAEDPDIWYLGAQEAGPYAGELELGAESEERDFRPGGEHRWESLGEGGNAAEIDRVQAEMAARKHLPSPRAGEGETPSVPPRARSGRGTARSAVEGPLETPRPEPAEGRSPPLDKPDPPAPDPLGPDDPRLDYRNWETGQYVPPGGSISKNEARPLAGAKSKGQRLKFNND